jgi:transcriptional regulator with XRE-family HTH domain
MYYAKKVLEDYGYTQKALAEKLGVSEMSTHVYVRKNPTLKSIGRMADALGADMIEFFTPLHKDDPLLLSMIAARKAAERDERKKRVCK